MWSHNYITKYFAHSTIVYVMHKIVHDRQEQYKLI